MEHFEKGDDMHAELLKQISLDNLLMTVCRVKTPEHEIKQGVTIAMTGTFLGLSSLAQAEVFRILAENMLELAKGKAADAEAELFKETGARIRRSPWNV